MQRQLTDEEERAIDILTGARMTAVCLLPDFEEEVDVQDGEVITFDTCGVCGDEYVVEEELAYGNTGDLCRYHWDNRFGFTGTPESSDSEEETVKEASMKRTQDENVACESLSFVPKRQRDAAAEISFIPIDPCTSLSVTTDGNLVDGRVHPLPADSLFTGRWGFMSGCTPRKAADPDTPAPLITSSSLMSSFKKEIYELNLMLEDTYPKCEGCRMKPPAAAQRHHMGFHGCLSSRNV